VAPVKARIRDIAALLVIAKLREQLGMAASKPSLPHVLLGQPRHRQDHGGAANGANPAPAGLCAQRPCRSASRAMTWSASNRPHARPRTKGGVKKAMGGVLFIDEAYYLYRPENERDYGQEAIEILLQVMENQRDDLVVILAGTRTVDTFFQSNPGMSSRIAHHLDFPDYSGAELLQIADRMLTEGHYRFGEGAREAFEEYCAAASPSRTSPTPAACATRSTRMRLRQASRCCRPRPAADRDD